MQYLTIRLWCDHCHKEEYHISRHSGLFYCIGCWKRDNIFRPAILASRRIRKRHFTSLVDVLIPAR